MYVTIKGGVVFAPNIGVIVERDALSLDGEKLRNLLNLAFEHINDPLLMDACHGGQGPFKDYLHLDFEDYMHLTEVFTKQIAAAEATTRAKADHIRRRRYEFASQRSALILAMLDAGIVYRCAHPTCEVCDGLAVDHILALSRGGSDELSNLQFLCTSHNSKKGDGRRDSAL